MQTEKPALSRILPDKADDATKALLAAGGLSAAFGVASCCAGPMLD